MQSSRQTSRKRRSTGAGNVRMGHAMGGQGANRLDVRVRGNTHQLHEKYKQMAKDAHQAGDRVATEYYLQHADHYFRILNDNRQRQEEGRGKRRNGNAAEAGTEEAAPRERDDEGNRSGSPRRASARDEAEAVGSERRRSSGRKTGRAAKDEMSDGEAALAAFGGAETDDEQYEPLILDLGEEEEAVGEAPVRKTRSRRKPAEAGDDSAKPVRRRRTRKTETTADEAREGAEI